MNGALLGFTEDEVTAMYDDIVEFAELEDFMDQKLKNYSSGMQVRLAFSVAIKAQGDILVLDEVLAVGDEAFQRKCDNFFTEIKKDPSKTVILVTHDMGAVKKYCNNAVLIKDGEVIASGDKDDVADRYTLENFKREEKEKTEDKFALGLNERVPLLRVNALSEQMLTRDDSFNFEVEYDFRDKNQDFYLAIALHDINRGGAVYDSGQKAYHIEHSGYGKKAFSVPLRLFNNGKFKLVVSLRTQNPVDFERSDMVAFTNEDNSGFFAVSDERNRDYALLNDTGIHFEEL